MESKQFVDIQVCHGCSFMEYYSQKIGCLIRSFCNCECKLNFHHNELEMALFHFNNDLINPNEKMLLWKTHLKIKYWLYPDLAPTESEFDRVCNYIQYVDYYDSADEADDEDDAREERHQTWRQALNGTIC